MSLPSQVLNKEDLFCNDLPTGFQPNIGKILVTGGTGYMC
jgi:hypothetical protein